MFNLHECRVSLMHFMHQTMKGIVLTSCASPDRGRYLPSNDYGVYIRSTLR